MFRSHIKLCGENLLKSVLRKRKEVFKRTFFIQQQHISNSQLLSPRSPNVNLYCSQILRQKGKKVQKAETDSDLDSQEKESESDEQTTDRYTKILKINVTSLRVDAVLKTALGIARHKVETLFYESKIRLNGEKVLKKSAPVNVGDEIDLIKGPDIKNPNFTTVARVEILSAVANEDSISLKIRRCKSLTIEAY